MASNPLDPYLAWLGLSQPPGDYYELLGLARFASDHATIEAKAAQQIDRLQQCEIARDSKRKDELLSQLIAAKRLLLDTRLKQQYDAQLRKQCAAGVSSELARDAATGTPLEAFDPMAPVVSKRASASCTPPQEGQQPPTAQAGLPRRASCPQNTARSAGERPSITSRSRSSLRYQKKLRQRRSYHPQLVLCFGLIMIAAAAGGIWLAVREPQVATHNVRERQPIRPAGDAARPAESSHTASPSPAPQAAPPHLVDPSATNRTLSQEDDDAEVADIVQPRPANNANAPQAESLPRRLEDAELRQLQQLKGAMITALRQRDVRRANRVQQQAAVLVEGSKLENYVAQWAVLTEAVDLFWQAFADGLRQLPGSDLQLPNRRVAVVAVSPQTLTIHTDGRNLQLDLNRLSHEMVMAIADQWLDNEAMSTNVLKGAYLLIAEGMEASSAKHQVRQLWETAIQEDAQFRQLSLLLEDERDLNRR